MNEWYFRYTACLHFTAFNTWWCGLWLLHRCSWCTYLDCTESNVPHFLSRLVTKLEIRDFKWSRVEISGVYVRGFKDFWRTIPVQQHATVDSVKNMLYKQTADTEFFAIWKQSVKNVQKSLGVVCGSIFGHWAQIVNGLLKPLNAELNPIRHLLALVEARHIVHVSRIRVTNKNRGLWFASFSPSRRCCLLQKWCSVMAPLLARIAVSQPTPSLLFSRGNVSRAIQDIR